MSLPKNDASCWQVFIFSGMNFLLDYLCYEVPANTGAGLIV